MKEKRFSTVLIIVNITIFFVFTSIVTTILLNYSKEIAYKNGTNLVNNTLVKISSDIDLMIETNVIKTYEYILFTEEIIEKIDNNTIKYRNSDEKMTDIILFSRLLENYHLKSDLNMRLTSLVNKKGVIYNLENPNDEKYLNDFFEEYIWNEQINTIKPKWYPLMKNPFNDNNEDDLVIVVSMNIINIMNGKYVGKQIYTVTEESIYNIYKDYDIAQIGEIEITDSEGKMISSSNREIVKGMNKATAIKDNIVLSHDTNDGNWIINVTVPKEYLYGNLTEIYATNIPVVGCIVLIVSIILIFISNMLTKPINPIIRSMEKAEKGDFTEFVKENGQYEMRMLAKYYNHLLVQIDGYVKNEVEISKKEKTAELDALIAQINPHFLSNTLESIVWQARMIGAEEISEMAYSLGKLFTLMVNKGKQTLTIENELEHVKMYMNIQNIRYKDKYKLVINANKELLNYETLKLILQPIIENSIIHGFNHVNGEALITVDVLDIGNDIVFKISDNGNGMSHEQFMKIRKKLDNAKQNIYDEAEAEKSNKKGNGIGLVNIHQRIRLYYGNDYGISIDNKDGICIFNVKIPKRV